MTNGPLNNPETTRRQRRLALLGALMVATAASLTACGGGGTESLVPPAGGGGTPAPTPPAPTPPAPTPPPAGGGSGVGSASNCYAPDQFVAGTRWVLDYQISGATTGTSHSDNEVTGNASFNGQSGIELVSSVDTSLSAPIASSLNTLVKTYSRADSAGVTVLGATAATTLMSITTTTTTRYNPAYLDTRWGLAAGESITLNLSGDSSISIPGLPTQPPIDFRSSLVVRFLGQEDVTVPAGSFSGACRFEVTSTDADGNRSVSNEWVTASGQGVAVKTVSVSGGSTSTLVLTSGSFNGVPVR